MDVRVGLRADSASRPKAENAGLRVVDTADGGEGSRRHHDAHARRAGRARSTSATSRSA